MVAIVNCKECGKELIPTILSLYECPDCLGRFCLGCRVKHRH